MKILSINSVVHGSTGNIMLHISELVRKQGGEAYVAYPNGRHARNCSVKNGIHIGGFLSEDFHLLLSRITGLSGCFSIVATLSFLRKVSELKPDIIHLHNLHNAYINLPILFSYIKKKNIKVVWTLHDCWSFTGHCPHFLMSNCNRWKDGCFECPQYKKYPKSFFDNSRFMWKLKKKWFCGVESLRIVTPSKWLADMVSESFLNDYPVEIINNGIDLTDFTYTESNLREKHVCKEKYIVLGVAYKWNESKGIDVFVELSKRLSNQYQIVLVGVDKRQRTRLPENIMCIQKTRNQKELAEWYSAANVFVNPTRQEVFGLVNVEALACGTPVITFDSGGSTECIDEKCGIVVPNNDIDQVEKEIRHICTTEAFSKVECIQRAMKYDKESKFYEYLQLYHDLIHQDN